MNIDLQIVASLELNTRLDKWIAHRLGVGLRLDLSIDADPFHLFEVGQLCLVLVFFVLFPKELMISERYQIQRRLIQIDRNPPQACEWPNFGLLKVVVPLDLPSVNQHRKVHTL